MTERRAPGWRRHQTVAIAFALGALLLVGGCTTDDDEDDEPTAQPTQTVAAPAPELTPFTPVIAPTPTTVSLTAANGQMISDRFCQVIVPDGWVDDGTGRGTTAGGHRFALFGNILRSDDDWVRAGDLVATPTARRAGAAVERTMDTVRVTFPDGTGFQYRARYGDRYCDFTVSSTGGEIAAEERAVWDAIVATMGPVAEP